MSKKLIVILCATFMSFMTGVAFATPSLSGSTGLLTQPTAETLNAGNICVGLWGTTDEADTTLVPVSITLGLGTLLEAYGSFPNILFNNDESISSHGYASAGMKLHLWGKRSSAFKVSISSELRRWVNEDINIDGLTDINFRDRFGISLCSISRC